MTKAEIIERYGIEYYNNCRERQKERYATNQEFREYLKKYVKIYNKERYATDPEFREQLIERSKEYWKERYATDPEFREHFNVHMKEYHRNDLNSKGKTKSNIRKQSSYILFDKRHHTKIKDYEIHHCFGYDDPSRFIYIPKSLHGKIHRYLRINNIDADSNHYDYIKYMINECDEYTYISI